jgi:outer membrane protein assembly factor BamB
VEYASPVVTDGVVYIGSDDGTIYTFGLRNGTQIKQDVSSTRPNLKTLRPDFNLKVSQPDATRPVTGNSEG